MVKNIHFKPGCRFYRWTPALEKILVTLRIVQNKYDWTPNDIWVTSVNDSDHKTGSRHYTDEAIDIRSKNFNLQDKAFFLASMLQELGDQFTVLYENPGTDSEHFHVQVKKGHTYSDN